MNIEIYSDKICATCEYWSGARNTDQQNEMYYYRVKSLCKLDKEIRSSIDTCRFYSEWKLTNESES